MTPRPRPLFPSASDRPIAVLGDVMLDRFLYGDAERISSGAPVAVLRHRQTRSMLGGAGNVARNIAARGGQAMLWAFAGAKSPGRNSPDRSPRRAA